MKILHFLRHLFLPHESNNQKAKLLHSSTLILISLFLIFYQLVLSFLPRLGPKILGYAANISPDEVIRLTNEKRVQNGLAPLSTNSVLSQAAQAKGADMLNKGYWAHVAPDGTQPWKFFADFGYKYRYAGENLARDFSNPASAVEAWMNSPSHRENLLSDKYKEIGVAVVEGSLAGINTTIIVQFFGTKYVDTIPAVPVAQNQPTATIAPTAVPTIVPAVTLVSPLPTPIQSGPTPTSLAIVPQVLVSPFKATQNFSLVIVGLLLAVLTLDALFVSRRRIVRIGGKSFAHLAFLGMILVIALILKAGQVL
jgi:hypothetical protein